VKGLVARLIRLEDRGRATLRSDKNVERPGDVTFHPQDISSIL